MPESIIFDKKIDVVLTLLEEGARAFTCSVSRFVEPMQGTIRRAKSKRHHIIYGRRGSGKSSLLHKTADILLEDDYPVAFVDLERFKGHHYPDVLISVLIAAFTEYDSWLVKYLECHKKKWYQLFKDTKEKEIAALRTTISTYISELKRELFSSDQSVLSVQSEQGENLKLKSRAKAASFGASSSVGAGIEQKSREVRSEEFSRTKTDFLHRKILDYQSIFAAMSKLTDSDCYLFLDDLYHIVRNDQPKLLDYIHRIAKGYHLWIKVGTIKHRSTCYVHAVQPTGLKPADDADVINLDQTLENYSTTKKFLTDILDRYLQEAHAPERNILISENGLERLAIASGGVPRDFLGLFRRAVDETRNRLNANPKHPRGPKIGAEDVNMGVGYYGESKREELNKDVLEDREILDSTLNGVSTFCLDISHANVFLLEQGIDSDEHQRINELIDLRLIHHIKSRVTVKDRPQKIYRALLLDVSFYAGECKRRKFTMIEFWKGDREELRKATLIYPIIKSDPIR